MWRLPVWWLLVVQLSRGRLRRRRWLLVVLLSRGRLRRRRWLLTTGLRLWRRLGCVTRLLWILAGARLGLLSLRRLRRLRRVLGLNTLLALLLRLLRRWRGLLPLPPRWVALLLVQSPLLAGAFWRPIRPGFNKICGPVAARSQ